MPPSTDTLRAAVVREMKRRKMNANQLALLLPGMNRQTVYNLVSGSHAISSDKLAAVFKVLGLRVVRRVK